jgi:ribonuclease HI
VIDCYCDGGGSNQTKDNFYGSFAFEHMKKGEFEIIRLPFPFGNTSNEAEYLVCIALLEKLLELGPNQDITIYADSALVVNQVNEKWAVRADNLRPFHFKATSLKKEIESKYNILVTLTWVSRKVIVKRLGH